MVYNNSKSDLKEKKAWSSSVKSLNNQMRRQGNNVPKLPQMPALVAA